MSSNKKKQYEYDDTEMPIKIEKKHLYEDIRKLNQYFYVCYIVMQMQYLETVME